VTEADTPARAELRPSTLWHEAHPAAPTRSPFVPLLLLAIALVAWLGFQAVQQVRDREQLGALRKALEPQEAAAQKVRASLDAVAIGTAKLAADGNASARAVIEELRKRGITVNAAGASKPQ
jgi:hypothetical protein